MITLFFYYTLALLQYDSLLSYHGSVGAASESVDGVVIDHHPGAELALHTPSTRMLDH
jgi:hypothetical protein